MTIIQFPQKEVSNKAGQSLLTLPVATRPFARIRFERTDSPVRAVPPAGALNWLEENLRQGAQIKAVNIDGPGDPLCAMDATMETLRLIRGKYSKIKLGITTLGLQAVKYAGPLARAGVTNVTLLVDSVDRKVAENLYAWIRPGRKTIPLARAVEMLMAEQSSAVKVFKEAGCTVTIRSTVYPGFNDGHIEVIARVMAESGADDMGLVPCKPTGPEDPRISPPDMETMQELRKRAAQYIKITLTAEKDINIGVDCSSLHGSCKSMTSLQAKPTKAKPNVAVVSSNGMEVDLHLGQAYQVLIYGPREDSLTCLLGTRPVPEPGSGSSRWEELAESLHDCFAILAASAGESPRRILGAHGITVLITDSEIEGVVDMLYGGGKKKCRKGKTM